MKPVPNLAHVLIALKVLLMLWLNGLLQMIRYVYTHLLHYFMHLILLLSPVLNVVKSPYLRLIFLMLWQELKKCDIPHRTSIHNRIMETWNKHMTELEKEMNMCQMFIRRLAL